MEGVIRVISDHVYMYLVGLPKVLVDDVVTEGKLDRRHTQVLPLSLSLSVSCPLPMHDQVDRRVLDFDFEPVCAVSLATTNIYACLACGKFFQGTNPYRITPSSLGRSQSTPAYMHALNTEHQLYMNLASGRAYQLPEGQEVDEAGLDDIRYAIYPTYSSPVGGSVERGVDLHGREFVVGLPGLNNIKANDYANVILHLLTHLPPLRDIFLTADLRSLPDGPMPSFLKALGLVTRKTWSPQPFKATMSPQLFLHAVRTASNDRFLATNQADPAEFMAWCLNYLERAMASVGLPPAVHQSVKGQLRVATSKVVLDTAMRDFYDQVSGRTETKTVPFYFLALDLPPIPLFQDHTGKKIIPQVALAELLHKYDGYSVTSRGATEQTFALLSLPKYLILHIKRFTKTDSGVEKNRTLVNFTVSDMHMGACSYHLMANISHVGDAKDGHYLVHLRHAGSWFEARDLEIKEIHPQTIFLTDTYIQVWERCD